MSSTEQALDLSELSESPVLVCTAPMILSQQQRARLVHELEQQLPDRKIIVLEAGLRLEGLVSGDTLQRLEAKVDRLLELLEGPEQLDATTIDGPRAFAAERDQTHPL